MTTQPKTAEVELNQLKKALQFLSGYWGEAYIKIPDPHRSEGTLAFNRSSQMLDECVRRVEALPADATEGDLLETFDAIGNMNTEDRKTTAEVIQEAQSTIARLQMKYRDTTPDFWALAVAWEAARFAWYVTEDDRGTAADKLHLLKDAIADYERKTATKEG